MVSYLCNLFGVSIVAADALVLQHQDISSNSTDENLIITPGVSSFAELTTSNIEL